MIHILFLDIDPKMCAYAHCDEDVKKKLKIYTKLLANAHHTLDPEGEILKSLDPPVVVFPSTQWWVEANNSNYQWLYDLWFWLNKEYWYRFDEIHDVWNKFYNKLSHIPNNIIEDDLSSPPQNIPEACMESGLEDEIQNTIAGHRNYYIKYCKENDVKWSTPEGATRTPPSWIIDNANV